MPTKKITDLTQLTDLDATDSFVVNDSGAGADKRVEFSDLQSEVLNGAAIGTSTAVTELQVDNLNLNGNTFSSTDTNGNVIIQPNGTGATIINESGAASDFRVEGDTDQNLLFVDASADQIGVGTNSTDGLLSVGNDATTGSLVSLNSAVGGSIRIKKAGTNTGFIGDTESALGSGDGMILYTYSGATRPIIFYTEGTEKMRIDSSGNVGMNAIPENSAGSWRNYQLGSLSMAGRSSNALPDAMFGTNFKFTTANAEQRISAHATSRVFFNDDVITFQNAGSDTAGSAISWNERMRILAGGGITFNGDTAAANALDDYEQGTWTPVITAQTVGDLVATGGGQIGGWYTKIGDIVNVFFIAQATTFTHSTASGEFRITGLPFTVGKENAGSFSECALINKSGYTQFNPSATAATTYIRTIALQNNGSGSVVNITDLPTGSAKYFYGSVTYTVS